MNVNEMGARLSADKGVTFVKTNTPRTGDFYGIFTVDAITITAISGEVDGDSLLNEEFPAQSYIPVKFTSITIDPGRAFLLKA